MTNKQEELVGEPAKELFARRVKKYFLSIHFLNKVVFTSFIVLGMAYLTTINDLTVKGFKLQELKSEQYRVLSVNKDREARATGLETVTLLNEKVAKMEMVKVGEEIAYLEMKTDSVAIK